MAGRNKCLAKLQGGSVSKETSSGFVGFGGSALTLRWSRSGEAERSQATTSSKIPTPPAGFVGEGARLSGFLDSVRQYAVYWW